MALVSPGVQVSVVDESFYTPSAPGTVPLIFVATQTNKTNPGGTGIAPGTTAANAGKVYAVTSQRELAETFGDPIFKTDANNNPIHGGEQNEYGLQAAYSFLGVANQAYVVRADVDLNAIQASATPTAGAPANASYWFDTDDSKYGIFQWNGSAGTVTGGQSFTNVAPDVITDTSDVVDFAGSDYTPKASVGAIGEYVLVAVTTLNSLWYKNSSNTWVEVGSAAWIASHPTVAGTGTGAIVIGETIVINGSSVAATGTTLTTLASDINTAAIAGIVASISNGKLNIASNGTGGDSVTIGGAADLLTAAGIASGTYYIPKLSIDPHTSVPAYKTSDTESRPTGSLWIKTTTPNLGANWSVKQYNANTASWVTVPATLHESNAAAIYALDSSGGGSNLAEGTVFTHYNTAGASSPIADFKLMRKNGSGILVAQTASAVALGAGTYTFTISESVAGSATMSTPVTGSFTVTGAETATETAEKIVEAISSTGLTNIQTKVSTNDKVNIMHKLGGEVAIVDTDGGLALMDPNNSSNIDYTPGTDENTSPKQYSMSHFKKLTYTASESAPTATPTTGTLWYSSITDEVDLMVHDGHTWKGYANVYPNTDPAGPIVAASAPLTQSDATALVEGDLWVSTADLENYPTLYRWTSAGAWELVDKTDQTTENGVLFADARYNTTGANSAAAGTIAALLASDHLDPDAPDPALYPRGMLLWNTRRSGFNVKRFERDYIDVNGTNPRASDESMSAYAPNRWVTESANNTDGSGSFGRHAQRKVVVQKLQASVNSNDDIRDDESRVFNMIATPGYPELIGEMINLNNDRGLTAFVVGDSPMRLQSNTTSINNWANNVALAVEDNDDGLVTSDEYLGVYYPSGFSSDNFGNNIVVPSSHMVMRTIALNDQVAYPWFAPAGTRRGGVTNATATGYINAEGEFTSIALNEGQRDVLYSANVNPITFLSGSGLVVFGQKTRASNASALDRVNVARLVVYLRRQLKVLAKPYIFEPNDKITRDQVKSSVESLMNELIGLRAIYDFLVVCDESNNTAARIDKNELYVDIAIEPVKAVEFIYIPLRLKNTGEIAGL